MERAAPAPGGPGDDLAHVPFSRRGSWWNLFRPPRPDLQPLGPGLYLRSNRLARVGRRELLRLELLSPSGVIPQLERARPHLLELHAASGRGRVELVLVGSAGALLRGRDVGLRLRAPGGFGQVAHFTADGRIVVTQHDPQRRCVLAARSARLRIDAPWTPDGAGRIAIDVLPQDGRAWELAIDEAESSWPTTRRPSFAATARACRTDWRKFRAPFGRFPRAYAAAAGRAVHILWSFTVPPCGLLGRPAVLMARGWMDAVWSWDNWFNVCALAAAHPRLALDQALLMADHQDEYGCYPDYVCPPCRVFTYQKPPVQGVLLRWLRAHVPRFLTPAVRRALYPTLAAFTRWWLAHRRWPGRRLCHYLHGNDGGCDNATLLDGGVPLESPDLNAYLVVQAEELARLAAGLGRPREAAAWLRTADELTEALLAELWDGDGFAGFVLSSGRHWRCRSLIPCLPLVLGDRLPAGHRRALTATLRGMLTPHGLASEHPESPAYEPDGYWRGPVWGSTTLLAVLGLEACGERALAATAARRFCNTCARFGFPENFDALTGIGRRDPAYSWTASAFLALLHHVGRRSARA